MILKVDMICFNIKRILGQRNEHEGHVLGGDPEMNVSREEGLKPEQQERSGRLVCSAIPTGTLTLGGCFRALNTLYEGLGFQILILAIGDGCTLTLR